MSRVGLVLGKFAPFHRGHEHLLRHALAHCERVHALVYDAPETELPTQVRADWIRALYPSVNVIEGIGAPTASGRALRVQRLQEAYIHSVLPEPVTHFFSSEWYGAHVSAALSAEDVRVDEARSAVPARGRDIRRDPGAHRALVDPIVFFDLVNRVVLLGAESTGKSSLVAALAEHCGTAFMEEHGRAYWLEHRDADGLLTPTQLVELAEQHRAGEVAAAQRAERMLFIDTDARVTRRYALHYHGASTPRLDVLADDCRTRYDLAVLCGDEIPYDEDGTRSGTHWRAEVQTALRRELDESGVPWIEARGPIDARVEKVMSLIEAMCLDRFKH